MQIKIQKRGYLHFDRPFHGDKALRAVSNPKAVASWQFMPFLHISLDTPKLKRLKDGSLQIKEKKRLIFYASHRDSALYYYYSVLLGNIYEKKLSQHGISDCATAFRKLTDQGKGKCNINFAKDVFDEISRHHNCTVFTFDIRSFFDNLDHKILKEKWSNLLGYPKLPSDHYAIFKSLTEYSYVDRNAVFQLFNINRSNRAAFRRQRICDPHEFREKVRARGFVKSHLVEGQPPIGIPQGSPISALLSNLYMFDFDLELNAAVRAVGGIYRRYCDDIICIIPGESPFDVDSTVRTAISKLKLEAHPEKSTVHRFFKDGENIYCDTPVQYLGFVFDGRSIRLRQGSLSRHYARMRAGVRLAHRVRKLADYELGHRTTLKTKRLNKTYTYLGHRTFIRYALRSADIMNSKQIRKQIKPHYKKFKKYLAGKNHRWMSIPEERFQYLRERYLSSKQK